MIIIKTDMPKNCIECPCYDREWNCCNLEEYRKWDKKKDGRPDNCPLIEIPKGNKRRPYYDVRRLKRLRGQTYTIEITERPNKQRLQMFLAQLKVYISSRQHRGADQDQKIEEYWNGAYWAIAQIEIYLEKESTKELSHGRE